MESLFQLEFSKQKKKEVEFKKNNQCLICDESKFNLKKISQEIEKIVFKKKLHKIESSKKLNHKLSLLNFIKKIIIENA